MTKSNSKPLDSGQLEPRRFELKGKRAEEAIHELAYRSFLREWCFPNPRWPDGKEICDLLVFFDGILLLFQIKDMIYTGNPERYLREAFDEPIRQAVGAERRLTQMTIPLRLLNANGLEETLTSSDIHRVHRMAVSLGHSPLPIPSLQYFKEKPVHTFDTSVESLLNELDTIWDFCKFLEAKEALLTPGQGRLIVGTELDLMAEYIYQGRSFKRLGKHSNIIFEEGHYTKITSKPEYIAKKREDLDSYFWDSLIDLTHTIGHKDYRFIARELSRLNRFERRSVSQAYFEAEQVACREGKDLRRFMSLYGHSYVFYFASPSMSRDLRQVKLTAATVVARNRFRRNHTVIGVATERNMPALRSYDFAVLDAPTLGKGLIDRAERYSQKFGIMKNRALVHKRLHEYPGTGGYDAPSKIGRNDPCPCGSGKKYKKCHGSGT